MNSETDVGGPLVGTLGTPEILFWGGKGTVRALVGFLFRFRNCKNRKTLRLAPVKLPYERIFMNIGYPMSLMNRISSTIDRGSLFYPIRESVRNTPVREDVL